MAPRVFLPSEFARAVFFTCLVEAGFAAIFLFAQQNRAHVTAQEVAPPEEIPISVKPVLDDLPLLKLGGKKMKARLPEMWRKQAPVQRVEEKSAPSPKAEKTPQAIPTTPLAPIDAGPPPPPDAAVAKEVDQKLLDTAAPPPPETSAPTEGAADGVKQGTETDPLKARAASLYAARLVGWFQVRFHPPGGLPCSVVHTLSAAATITVGADRSITGYTLSRASNNAVFDAKVKSTLDGLVGQQLPPPPPLYPDLTPGALIRPSFSGKEAPCE